MTREKFRTLKEQITTQYITLGEVIKTLDDKEKFCIGANSSYFFYGDVMDLQIDIKTLDKYYCEKHHENTGILDARVIDIRAKHSYEPQVMTAFIIDGNRPGRCWFSYEYPAFLKELKIAIREKRQYIRKNLAYT